MPVPEAATPGRRERKKAETRLALRSAATTLVAKRGLDGVTIEDITEHADVSPRTFFNYFATKEEALTAVDEDRLARLRVAVLERPAAEPPLTVLRHVLVATAGDLTQQRDDWLRRLEVVTADPRLLAALVASWAAIERTVADAVRSRPDPPDPLAAAATAAAAIAVFRCAIVNWRDDGHRSLPSVVASAFDAVCPSSEGTTR